MMRQSTFAFALAAAGMLAAPSFATAAEEKLGPEGVFTMIAVKNGNKFDRCIMHQGAGNEVLRIASSKSGVYSLSIPTAGLDKSAPLSIKVDNKAGYRVPITGQDKARTWATLPPDVVNAIKAGRQTIAVDLGPITFRWRLNSDMKGSFIVLDSCVEGYTRGA